MNKEPIFILGAHKSGTSLLRSLLDGHPSLFVVPFESHFFENFHYWIDNPFRTKRPKNLSADKLYHSFLKAIEFYNSKSNKYGDVVLGGKIDTNAFEKHFEVETGYDLKAIFQKYYQAIYYSLYNRKLKDKVRLVEKSVENLELVPELRSMYPEAKFIHIVRNPYANIVSLRSFRIKSGGDYPILAKSVQAIYNSLYYSYKNNIAFENYRVLRYEDLVSEPIKQLKSLADFLGIDYNPIILQPTNMGELWKGNSVKDYSFSKVSKGSMNTWKREISTLEIKFVNTYFHQVLDLYNYDRVPPNKGRRYISEYKSAPQRYFFNLIYLAIQKKIR